MTTVRFCRTTHARIVRNVGRGAQGSHRSELKYCISMAGSLSVSHTDPPDRDYDGSDDAREWTPELSQTNGTSRQPRRRRGPPQRNRPTRTSSASTSRRGNNHIFSPRHSDDGVTDHGYGSEVDRLGDRRAAFATHASRRVRPRYYEKPVAEEDGEDEVDAGHIQQDAQDVQQDDQDLQEDVQEAEVTDEEDADWEPHYGLADSGSTSLNPDSGEK